MVCSLFQVSCFKLHNALERSHSGRVRRLGKAVDRQKSRGFDSLPLRPEPEQSSVLGWPEPISNLVLAAQFHDNQIILQGICTMFIIFKTKIIRNIIMSVI